MEPIIHFVTYGDNNYSSAKNRISQEAKNFQKFTSINVYSHLDIDKDFFNKYNDILSLKRGGGYWLWKEYIILKKLNEINDGEYIVYCDAGCTINKYGIYRFNEYINMLENDTNETGIISFQMNECIEERFTTSQIFSILNANDKIKKSGQFMATILIMKKCKNVLDIFNEFFKIVDIDHKLITDHYNKNNQQKIFIDNRHDQSILSVIRKQKNTIIISDETWYKNFNCTEAQKIPFLATRKK